MSRITPRWLGLAGAALALLGAAGCAPSGGYRITPVPADQTLERVMVERESPWISEKIALIDIDGVLANGADRGLLSSSENPVALISEKLSAAADDPSIRAVVLRINSPGGTVTASEIVYQEIQRLKARTHKPVVAILLDVAASGGYYVACAADEIIAYPTTVTGSIGVLMQTVSLSGTMNMLGVKADAITSGPLKDAGSPFRDLKPEERQIFQTIVNTLYERFVEVVAAGRPKLSREAILTLADGRVYAADQALGRGLVDRIGTIRDALESARSRAGLRRANTVAFVRPLGWKGSVYASAQNLESPVAGSTTVNMVSLNVGEVLQKTPTFLYLWRIQ
ncbi:MAG: signal peptide peptidase SppA [Phycisphaerae bacterium]